MAAARAAAGSPVLTRRRLAAGTHAPRPHGTAPAAMLAGGTTSTTRGRLSGRGTPSTRTARRAAASPIRAPASSSRGPRPGAAAAPFAAPPGGAAARAAREALAQAWGRPAVDIGAGGTIPFITAYAARHPGAEILVTGVEDPDTRAHGANESLHLPTFQRACLAEALLLRSLERPAPR